MSYIYIYLKLCNLLWRAASKCLPCKFNLHLRRVPLDVHCHRCPSIPETIRHCLVDCPFAKKCWQQAGFFFPLQVNESFALWLESLLKTDDDDKLSSIGVICYSIWRARNDEVWKKKKVSVASVLWSSKHLLSSWVKAQDRNSTSLAAHLEPNDGDEQWQKPPVGTVKISTDAAIFQDQGTYSAAVLARNHEGTPIEAFTCCKVGSVSPAVAEAMSVKEALSWLKKKRWTAVILETDCLSVVQALRGNVHMPSYFGAVIEDCRRLMANTSNIVLRFIKRSANKAAHSLARASFLPAERIFNGGELPPAILDVIMRDSV